MLTALETQAAMRIFEHSCEIADFRGGEFPCCNSDIGEAKEQGDSWGARMGFLKYLGG
jgi:hypothetical protein